MKGFSLMDVNFVLESLPSHPPDSVERKSLKFWYTTRLNCVSVL